MDAITRALDITDSNLLEPTYTDIVDSLKVILICTMQFEEPRYLLKPEFPDEHVPAFWCWYWYKYERYRVQLHCSSIFVSIHSVCLAGPGLRVE